MPDRRPRTATSAFGVGRREAHDASAFYARFEPPELADDDTVLDPDVVARKIGDPFKTGDAADMADVPDGSVALVVTSPPYFAGKQYEEELGASGVPASYAEYLAMLEAVLAECVRTLEPGGRIAVNVANLGRKPYRSLSADVVTILQDRLRLLLRGEIIWRKQQGAAGNCAWGSFAQPANPSIRDLTERVVVASKGRFDRALSADRRRAAGLPHRATITPDRYMAATLDVWELPPERASRVGHPAPFPIELPEWLIDLYTYTGDLVLDPFLGSGSTAVAASRMGRRFVGYDLDPDYVDLARERVADEGRPQAPETEDVAAGDTRLSMGRIVGEQLERAGFAAVRKAVRVGGVGVSGLIGATDAGGGAWLFDVIGNLASDREGLRRTDAVWRALGRAAALHQVDPPVPLVVLTSHLPRSGTDGERALRSAVPGLIFDVIGVASTDDQPRLAAYATGRQRTPLPGFWPTVAGART